MSGLDLAETSVLVALAEHAILGDALELHISEKTFLLSACLRDDQIGVLENVLKNFQGEGLVASWGRHEAFLDVVLTDDFPLPKVGPLEREKLHGKWLKRVLLSQLYIVYSKGQQRYTHFPLATLSKELGIDREEIFRAVKYLDDECLLEYGVCDGGNCTSDITSYGIEMCDNRNELFDQLSIIQVRAKPAGENAAPIVNGTFIANSRIEELRSLDSRVFDFARLIEMCRELNVAHSERCNIAIAMLVRAILDHVPPVFGCRIFSEVANNYSGGRSFAMIAKRLQGSARVVADMNLHNPICAKEPLPSFQQVNCASELDCLLAEIVKVVSSTQGRV